MSVFDLLVQMNDAIIFWPVDIKEELRSHIFKHAVFQHLKTTTSKMFIKKQSLRTSLKTKEHISSYLLINSYLQQKFLEMLQFKDNRKHNDNVQAVTMARWKTPPTGPRAQASLMSCFAPASVLTSVLDTSTSTSRLCHSRTRFSW